MSVVAVDPADYADAAGQLTQVAQTAGRALSTLTGALDGSSGMGGSDHAGVEWSHGYDAAAKSALAAAANAVTGAGQVAVLLHATGTNHARADASSTIGGGDASLPPAPAPPNVQAPSVPSAAGGSGGGPTGWSLVAGLVGYAWPNGHQDRLHAAQAAWSAAGTALGQAAGPVSAAASRVSAQQSPEAGAAANACTQIGTQLSDLAGVCSKVGQSCGQYAAHLDQAHHEILSELKDLLIQTAAIEAGGAVLAFVTAGVDEVAAQAATAARIAAAAAKIRRIIETLIEAARTVAAAVKSVGSRALEILAKLKPLVESTVKKAATTAVRGADDGATEAASAGTPASGLSAAKHDEIVAMEKGTRPDPSEYLSPQYIENHLNKFTDGASRFMPEENFERFGITQRDGTTFVMPKAEADAIQSGGSASLEQSLGLPEGYLQDNGIVRADISDPQKFNLRIPSGNEAGANDQWIPGGILPNGASEAVIDGGEVPPGGYSVIKVQGK